MRLSKYFSEYEFRCKCGCGICNVSNKLLGRLDLMRDIHGKPMRNASGCRCKQHNRNEGGKPDSSHLTTEEKPCEAFDIKAKTSRKRYELIRDAIEAGFTRIGIGRTFIHVDVDENKTQEIIWLY